MFIETSIWSALQLQLKQPSSGNIRDIYDGQSYKVHFDFLSNLAHISLLLNTDGVAIFRSYKFNIWPIWIVINELPKKITYNRIL